MNTSQNKIIIQCPKCKNTSLTYDYGSKKIICKSCGIPLTSYEKIKKLEEEKNQKEEEIEKLKKELGLKLNSNNDLPSKILQAIRKLEEDIA